jgi:hypothetical protein
VSRGVGALCSPDRTSRPDRPAAFVRPISSSTTERSDLQAGRVAKNITLAPRGLLRRRSRRPGSATREQADLATTSEAEALNTCAWCSGPAGKALQVIRDAQESLSPGTHATFEDYVEQLPPGPLRPPPRLPRAIEQIRDYLTSPPPTLPGRRNFSLVLV